MAVIVTREQLKRLRSSLRDGRLISSALRPQLLAAYRSTAMSSRERLTQVEAQELITNSGFQLIVYPRREKSPTRAELRKEKKKVAKAQFRYEPTRVLGRRSTPVSSQRKEEKKQVTISDLAAQRRLTERRTRATRLDERTLRGMMGVALNVITTLLR